MTDREQAAFRAGIEAARQMALTAAVSLEIRPDAREVRQQAAAAALQGLADGLRAAFLDRPDPTRDVLAVIAADPAQSGEIPCPECAGRLRWVKDSGSGHIAALCETGGVRESDPVSRSLFSRCSLQRQ